VTRYIALLRAVNLGGNSTLAMADLVSLCEGAGFSNICTYVASGNVVFDCELSEAAAGLVIGEALRKKTGKAIDVLVRSGAQLGGVLDANPFSQHPPYKVGALFVDAPLPDDLMLSLKGHKDEQIVLGERVIYVYYPQGMGKSRLNLPYAAEGTMRNMNTVAKLAAMAGG
jgi:uncharacterized protein (DUF1697 family)